MTPRLFEAPTRPAREYDTAGQRVVPRVLAGAPVRGRASTPKIMYWLSVYTRSAVAFGASATVERTRR